MATITYTPRKSCPGLDEKWWKTSFSPCITGSAYESSVYGTTLPNCFSGDTEIITDIGVKQLKELVGRDISIPTIDGWRMAKVNYFGKQVLWEVKLRNGHTYRASGNHRWVIFSQSGKTHRIVHTCDLTPGMFIRDTFVGECVYPDNMDGIRHGFVYGDGTGSSNIHTCANICGYKKTFMPAYFSEFKITEWADGTLYVGGQIPNGKQVPSVSASKEYIYNFLRGYFAADGSVDVDGYSSITCCNEVELNKINDLCWLVGIKTTGVRKQYDSGYTGYRWVYNLTLRGDSLNSSFFLNPEHRRRFNAKTKKNISRTTVQSVSCLNVLDDVYCPVEPVTHTCTLGGGELTGQCVGYAWGRFAEIMGGYATGLPSCNAGDWYSSDNTHEKTTNYNQPRLGAAIVWKKPGAAGHVAIVEEIERDSSGNVVSITTSESGWGNAWSNRFYTNKRTPPNYANSPYQFVGFIYNPAVSGDAVSAGGVDISSPLHPARRFVAEAESHVGANGHAWVQSMTNIGNAAWCAATMCAVAKACGFADIIMPSANYWASGFGEDIVEKYGGQYFAGPMMGGSFTPQIGDIIEYSNANQSGTYNAGTRYAAYHVGVVRGVEGNKVLTVEGNTNGGQYQMNEKDINGSNIGWYARPDWTKVGGSLTPGGLMYGGQLYTTESTRADASLREVGYLTKDGQPSIKSTGVKLNVINYTGLLSKFVKVFGGSSSSGTVSGSPDNIDALPAVPREIVEYLVGKGLNTAAAIGIIGNIEAESNFNTAAVGDYGTSFGICQWHNARGTAMKRMAGSNWASNLTGQLNYLWHELSSGYKTSVLDPLMEVPNTLEGAKKAADIFVRKFEIPANVDAASQKRQSNAEKYWNMVIVTSADGVVDAAQGKITTQSGQVITTGTTVVIPSSVPQTGIVANYTSYTQFYGRWSSGTIQRQLSEIWGQQGKPSKHCVATINGYYLVAMSSKFATTGDIVSVVFEDGTYFNAILGDSKGSDAGSEWGHYLGSQIDIIEWEAMGTDQSALREGLRQWGILGKKVAKVVNYGAWLR